MRCYNNVGIANTITAYARISMYQVINPLRNHICYIDTDGILRKYL